jgi:hypothetical protein
MTLNNDVLEHETRKRIWKDLVFRSGSKTITADVVVDAMFADGYDAAFRKAVKGIAPFTNAALDSRVRLVSRLYMQSEDTIRKMIAAAREER